MSSIPDQSRGHLIVSQQPKLVIGRGDALPARGILLTNPVGVPPDQGLHMFRLKQQSFAALFRRIVLQDQVDRRLLVRKRIGPAFQAGGPERRHPVRMGLYLGFGGAQIVAVEIDSVRFGREDAVRSPKLIKDERLVGAVRDHCVGPAGQEIARVAIVSDARQSLIVDPFARKHGSDLIAARRVHERTAAQIRYAADIRSARNQDDDRRVLKDGCQHD